MDGAGFAFALLVGLVFGAAVPGGHVGSGNGTTVWLTLGFRLLKVRVVLGTDCGLAAVGTWEIGYLYSNGLLEVGWAIDQVTWPCMGWTGAAGGAFCWNIAAISAAAASLTWFAWSSKRGVHSGWKIGLGDLLGLFSFSWKPYCCCRC